MRGKYLDSYYQKNFDPDVCPNDYGPPDRPNRPVAERKEDGMRYEIGWAEINQ